MQKEILKYKIIERYLNKVKFNNIPIGSLLAQYYALDFINKQQSKTVFTNLLLILKYSITLWNNKKIKPLNWNFIFTKLSNRFHFNVLMDPLIRHYSDNSIILCDEKSFDKTKFDIEDIQKRTVSFAQTNSNYGKDAQKILKTSFFAFYILIKNRKRLQISITEVIYFVNNLLVQIRRASFWDQTMTFTENKPLCVVTEFDRCSESAPLILVAKKHKISTVTLIHGVLEDYSFIPFLADYIFCWGNAQKSQLITKFVDPNRIVITGNPIFKYELPKTYSDNHGLNICLAVGPGFDNRTLIEPFLFALNQIENARGIIKLHPSLEKNEFEWVNTITAKIEVLSSKDINNGDLFRKIDLLIINDSGIGNEALTAGVPVVVLAPEGTNKLNEFQTDLVYKAGCSLSTNREGLELVLNDILNNPSAYRKDSVLKSHSYLKNLYDSAGNESVLSMISEIDRISGI